MKYVITEEQYGKLWFSRRHHHIKEVVEEKLKFLLDNFEHEKDYFESEVIFRSVKQLATDYKLPYQLQIQLEDYIRIHFGNMISNAWNKKFRPTQF